MWRRTGGGCHTQAGGADRMKYPCDDDWENDEGERVNIRSAYGRHFNLPDSVASLSEIYKLKGIEPRVVCDLCKQDMMHSDGCTVGTVILNDVSFTRLKETLCGEFEDGERCHDCNAKPDNHHHYQCDNEPCPRCGGQLFICDCEHEE